MPSNVLKVVIVGGGCAGLATAWHLSKLNEDQKTKKGSNPTGDVYYDITVYERSWRLGGKGASGRDEHGRILEHGLHVWLGFYENAFRMMRECYDEVQKNGWGPDSEPGSRLTHASFDEAFTPEPHVGVAQRRRNGDLQVWSGLFPPMPGQPGEPLDVDTNPFTLLGYLARALGLARALLQSVLAPASGAGKPGDPRPNGRSTFDEAVELDFDFDILDSPGVLVERMSRLLKIGALTSAAGLLQAVTILESWIRERSPAVIRQFSVVKFVEAVATHTRKQLEGLVEIDEELRRKTEIIDLLMTITVGLYRDKVLFSEDGLDAINDIDYRDWLLQHGATRASVESAFVTGIYDLVFAYRDGDRHRPALAAGQALRGALRMFFTYRGAMFWRLGSGMGDAVFAPLYRVLLTRGVKFKFSHELTNVRFEPARKAPTGTPGGHARARRISQLTFTAHETSKADRLDHLGCWPNVPASSPRTRKPKIHVLRQANQSPPPADSFDVVVLATGVDRFKELCGTLCADFTTWREMCDQVKTVGTVSAQVWLDRDLERLGWRRGSTLVSAFDGRFNTWADMSRLLASEQLHRLKANPATAASKARALAYFCGVVPDDPGQRPRVAEYRRALEALLSTGLKPVWPAAYSGNPDATALDRLVSADGGGAGTVADQYLVVNSRDSDRYTLSLPGSLAYRISPLDSTVANMTIAGDWTECGFNAGCVEAAVMSGMLAAHAISGLPDLNSIVGYHHP